MSKKKKLKNEKKLNFRNYIVCLYTTLYLKKITKKTN